MEPSRWASRAPQIPAPQIPQWLLQDLSKASPSASPTSPQQHSPGWDRDTPDSDSDMDMNPPEAEPENHGPKTPGQGRTATTNRPTSGTNAKVHGASVNDHNSTVPSGTSHPVESNLPSGRRLLSGVSFVCIETGALVAVEEMSHDQLVTLVVGFVRRHVKLEEQLAIALRDAKERVF